MMSNMYYVIFTRGTNNMSPFYSRNLKSKVLRCANANYFLNPRKVNPKEDIYLFMRYYYIMMISTIRFLTRKIFCLAKFCLDGFELERFLTRKS